MKYEVQRRITPRGNTDSWMGNIQHLCADGWQVVSVCFNRDGDEIVWLQREMKALTDDLYHYKGLTPALQDGNPFRVVGTEPGLIQIEGRNGYKYWLPNDGLPDFERITGTKSDR